MESVKCRPSVHCIYTSLSLQHHPCSVYACSSEPSTSIPPQSRQVFLCSWTSMWAPHAMYTGVNCNLRWCSLIRRNSPSSLQHANAYGAWSGDMQWRQEQDNCRHNYFAAFPASLKSPAPQGSMSKLIHNIMVSGVPSMGVQALNVDPKMKRSKSQYYYYT